MLHLQVLMNLVIFYNGNVHFAAGLATVAVEIFGVSRIRQFSKISNEIILNIYN